MAYNAITQADDVASNASDPASRTPSPQLRCANEFQPVPLNTANLGGDGSMEPASEDSGLGRLGSVIRSIGTANYEVLEDDDYEVAQPATSPKSPNLPMRGSSIRQSLPLDQPTPDLQALQGAYVGNVERLEKSAECLSSSSADIGSEIRRIDQEQKMRSGGSASNSIVGRNSRHSSFKCASESQAPFTAAVRSRSASGTYLAQIAEPEHDQVYRESSDRIPISTILPPIYAQTQHQMEFGDQDHTQTVVGNQDFGRPASVASNDTYQQARTLFTDFDGVHFISDESGHKFTRHVSLTRPPLARGSHPHKEPQVGEQMVYYPAPVPMMLNLPPRLSRKPNESAEREKRRTQLLDSVLPEERKPPGQNQNTENGHSRNKPLRELPPQLRASVFFEPPKASVDIKVREASAVATFDSILDASAHAPVAAFTDHPFAGHRGSDIYGRPGYKVSPNSAEYQARRRQSHRTFLPKQTEHKAADVHESTALRSDLDSDTADGSPDEPSEYDDSDRSHSENEESQDEDHDYMGPPNTLLAELQLRKQELQQRRRTVGNSVGIHSTLLELDAVAQRQQDHRQHKRVTLAWESPDPDIHDDPDDEDVPLAMLYPDKANDSGDARSPGLLEQRQQEENEPLSRRRARLRGEVLPAAPTLLRARPSTMNFPPVAASDSGDEETLGQRLKRLRAKDRGSVAGQSDFTVEVLAELSHLNDDGQDDQDKENETLRQRRVRLQKESKLQNGLNPKTHRSRQSMADISGVRPATFALQPSHEQVVHRNSMDARVYTSQLSLHPARSQVENMTSGIPQGPRHERVNTSAPISRSNTFYSDAILGMNSLAYANPPHANAGPVIESGQRDIINRWRQSVN